MKTTANRDSRHAMCRLTACGTVLFLALAVLLLIASPAWAQRATGVITGRVITEDGQPVRHASVSIGGMGGKRQTFSGRLAIITDDDGNFQADGLDAMPYQIGVTAPGYVMLPGGKTVDQASPRPTNYAYVGESVTITMVRGGVITGRITNVAGEPVIGAVVKAERVRDEAGRPIKEQGLFFSAPRQTDDRGIYRLYGLMPGSYIVSIGGSGRNFGPRTTPYENRLPVYYPSATRDTAMEVTVRSGEEAGSIDIRYRAERGFAVSGKVLGLPTEARTSGMIITTSSILLRQPGTGSVIASTFIAPIADQNNAYAFYGVPNGEYEAVATRSPQGDEPALESTPRRVTINGTDVTGVDLTMAPLGSLAGTVTIDKASASEQKCEAKREFYLNEVVVGYRRDEATEKDDSGASIFSASPVGVPDEKGAFTLRGLKAGHYRLTSQLPDENWYVKSISMPGTPMPTDVGRNGVMLKAGERLTGVNATIASGAAGLKGKITAAAGIKLPPRVRVYLLPAEPEAKENLLRFAEVKADDNGAFIFSNLAPGKYLLTTRPIPETEPTDKPAKPAFWEMTERAKLRKEAEAANSTVELKACQRVADFTLRLGK